MVVLVRPIMVPPPFVTVLTLTLHRFEDPQLLAKHDGAFPARRVWPQIYGSAIVALPAW